MSFGIDFGTSNSVVARWNGATADVVPIDGDNLPVLWRLPEFEQLFPSVVSVRDVQRTLCFGWAAKTGTAEPLDAVKRMLGTRSGADRERDDEQSLPHLEEHEVWIGGETYPSTAAAASLFSRMREGVASQFLDISEAVVTVPANATGGARYRTRAAAKLGGIQVKALLNEPTAAAISYVHDVPVPGTFLVFDWGGGTIDVTVLAYEDNFFEEKSSRGITALGGLEFDEELAKLILRKMGTAPEKLSRDERRHWRRQVELTKIALSSAPPGGQVLFEPTATELGGRGLKAVSVTVEEYRQAVAPLIQRALAPVEEVLKDLRITPDAIDSVLLIGGTSQIPQVREALGQLLGADRVVDPRLCRPMTAVARGAAIYAASLDGELPDSEFPRVSNYDLGTAVTAGRQRGFRSIISRNSLLPAQGMSVFQPSLPFAASVHVDVVEGEAGYPADSDRAFPLASFDIPLPTREAEPARNRIEIRFQYNESGILRFTATHAETGLPLEEREIDSFGPDGTPLQEGLEGQLTRLLSHTVRPFAAVPSKSGTTPADPATGAGRAEPLSPTPESRAAAPARPRVVRVPDAGVSVNGEAQLTLQ